MDGRMAAPKFYGMERVVIKVRIQVIGFGAKCTSVALDATEASVGAGIMRSQATESEPSLMVLLQLAAFGPGGQNS